jgi:hypothetical protein
MRIRRDRRTRLRGTTFQIWLARNLEQDAHFWLQTIFQDYNATTQHYDVAIFQER